MSSSQVSLTRILLSYFGIFLLIAVITVAVGLLLNARYPDLDMQAQKRACIRINAKYQQFQYPLNRSSPKMFLKPQKRRCLRCGHTFTYMQGDLIFELLPKCPKCGSHLTCKATFF